MEIHGSATHDDRGLQAVIDQFESQKYVAMETIKTTASIINMNRGCAIDITTQCETLKGSIGALVVSRTNAINILNRKSSCHGCQGKKGWTWAVTLVDGLVGLAALGVAGANAVNSQQTNTQIWWSPGLMGLSTLMSKFGYFTRWKRVEWIRIQTQLEQIKESDHLIQHYKRTLKAFEDHQRLHKVVRPEERDIRNWAKTIRRLPLSMTQYVRPDVLATSLGRLAKYATDRRDVTIQEVSDQEIAQYMSRYYQRRCSGLNLDIDALRNVVRDDFAVVEQTVSAVGSLLSSDSAKPDLTASIVQLRSQQGKLAVSFAIVKKILDAERGNTANIKNRVICQAVTQGVIESTAISTDIIADVAATTEVWNQAFNITSFVLFCIAQIFSRVNDYNFEGFVQEVDAVRALKRLHGKEHYVEHTYAMIQTFETFQFIFAQQAISARAQEDALLACRIPRTLRHVVDSGEFQRNLARRFPETDRTGEALAAKLRQLKERYQSDALLNRTGSLREHRKTQTRKPSIELDEKAKEPQIVITEVTEEDEAHSDEEEEDFRMKVYIERETAAAATATASK